jgi:hypothetical protein
VRRLLLILTGLLAAALAVAKLAVRERSGEERDEIDLAAVLESRKVRMRSRPFQGGTLMATAAAVELDLRRVVAAPTGIELAVFLVGSSLRLVVPTDWNLDDAVVRRVATVTFRSGAGGDDEPTMRIVGSAWFSRLEVVARPTMTAVAS